MGDDILTICRELDDLTIRALELMEEQIKCKLKMKETMKESCMDLAKARYIMGNNSVSYLQLPTEESSEFRALKTVTSSVETKNKLEHAVFELHTIAPEKKPCGKQECDSSIRRRGGKDDDTIEEIDLRYRKSEENGIVAATDPMKWFGYLVPQNLRQAQKGFQMTLDLVIQSANIQSELVATCEKCNKLSRLKSTLSATSS